jgi:hypothetical protein
MKKKRNMIVTLMVLAMLGLFAVSGYAAGKNFVPHNRKRGSN